MKRVIKTSLLFIALVSILGCVNILKLSDLQTQGYHYPNNLDKAKLLLKEMGVAHHIHLWDSLETYTVIYEDEFYGFLGKKAHPFKEQNMKFSLNYIPRN